jgi:hypothetical protein
LSAAPFGARDAVLRIGTRAVSVSLLRSHEEDTMYRQRPARSRPLTLDELEDAQGLRSVIGAALAAKPLDEESLCRAVRTYVRDLCTSGTRLGHVTGVRDRSPHGARRRIDTTPTRSAAIRHAPGDPLVRRGVLRLRRADVVGGSAGVPSRHSAAPNGAPVTEERWPVGTADADACQ